MAVSVPELQVQLDAAATQIAISRRCIQKTPPRLLHHYTTVPGLLGILESSSIWATHARYLNDASELRYVLDLYDEVADSRSQVAVDELGQEFLYESRKALQKRVETSEHLYVACFCEDGDLLNQWRVYAGSSGGLSVAFAGNALATTELPEHFRYTFRTLRKVEYEPLVQRECVAQVIDCILSAIERLTPDVRKQNSGAIVPSCCYFLHTQMVEYMACFKHPSFSVEHEWRICQHVSEYEHVDLRFRNGPFGVTPYLALQLPDCDTSQEGRLPIKAVRFGPSTNPDNARFALTQLLKSRGYPDAQVTGTTLPVRVGL